MKHAMVVGFGERFGDLLPVSHQRRFGQRLAIEEGRQRASLDVFHDDEVDAVHVADVEHRADVGVAEGREGSGFPLEAAARVGIDQQLGPQRLQRYAALQSRVPGFVDLSHPAAAEQRHDFIGSEGYGLRGATLGREVHYTEAPFVAP